MRKRYPMDEHGVPGTTPGAGETSFERRLGALDGERVSVDIHDTTRRWAQPPEPRPIHIAGYLGELGIPRTHGPVDDRPWVAPAPEPERDGMHPGRYLLTVAALAAVVAALYLTAVLTDGRSPGWAWLVPALATMGGFVGGCALPRREPDDD